MTRPDQTPRTPLRSQDEVLRQKRRVQEYFNADEGWQGGMYQSPDDWFARSVVRRREYTIDIIRQLDLPPQAAVLDVGFGSGVYLERLAGLGYRCSGIDLSAGMIEATRRRLEAKGIDNVELSKGDIEDLPIAGESQDLVLSMGVLGYLPNVDRAVGEIVRVLKPGGYWITNVANGRSLSNFDFTLRRMMKSLLSPSRRGELPGMRRELSFVSPWIEQHSPAHHQYRLFHPRRLVRRVEEAGFRIRKEMSFGFQLRLLRRSGVVPAPVADGLENLLEKTVVNVPVGPVRYAGDSYTAVFQKEEKPA